MAMYPDELGIFFQEIIVGSGGVFVYSSTPPAFGTLVGNISASGGTDPYGNVYLGGEVTYAPGGPGLLACQNAGGIITFFTATTAAGPWSAVGSLQITGTTSNALAIASHGYLLVQSGVAYVEPLVGPADDGAAINAIYAAGIKTVLQAAGTYSIGTAIAIPDGGSLFGSGLATINKMPNSSGATQNIITNTSDVTNCTVANMLIDGNRANNAGTWQSGIVFNNPTTDPHHQVRGVKIQNCTGDGFVQAGRGGGTVVSDVSIIHCDGFGINTIFDAEFVNVDIGNSGIDGVLIQGGSTRLSNVKAWFSGDKLVSSRGASATLLTVTAPANAWDGGNITGGQSFSLAGGWGNGFHWTNISGTTQGPAGRGGTNAALTAQDNARAGFYNDGTGGAGPPVVIAGVEADSNNNNGTNGGIANGAYAGIDWGATGGYVEGKSFDRGSNVCKQQAALNVVATSGFIGNRFRLHFEGTNPGALADGSNMPPLTAGSVPTTNDCEFNAQGRSLRPIAASGTVNIDPFLAETFSTTVSGALTVNAPALTGTNTTGLFLVQGMKIALALTQDGVGGHAITLNAVFRLNGLAFSVVAGATTVIQFVWDGTFWQAIQ